jgi:hypothetical protein
VIHFHGTADPLLPFEAEAEAAETASGIVAMLGAWAERNGCSGETQAVYQKGDVTCMAYQGCQDDATVTLCTVEGGGHTWPGHDFSEYVPPEWNMGPTTQDIDASRAIWEFFAQHPVPPPEPSAHRMKMEPLAELEGYCSAIVVGPSSWGVRVVSPIHEGTLTGPRLSGRFLPVGGDFMLVRADGCFEQDARVVIETNDGATIYSAYQGLSALTQEQLEQFMAGEVPEGLVFYTTLRFETAHPDYQWLTRIQAVGMGSIEAEGDLVKWKWSWYELAAESSAGDE